MSAEDILTISAAVVALTEIAKWATRRTSWGRWLAPALALVGVAIWATARGTFALHDIWAYFAGWVAVAASASGVYGFVRRDAGKK